jgi:hypothetical protein
MCGALPDFQDLGALMCRRNTQARRSASFLRFFIIFADYLSAPSLSE